MKNTILNMFRFDLRLLGIFRILLGFLVIVDLLRRCVDLTAFYTDQGVLPRKILLENDWNSWNFSINMATGSFEGQALIFGFALFCALMVLIGLRTKIFLMLLYLLVVSIQVRNPQITHGGDTVIKLMIFYAIFLPVNARYAVDKCIKATLPSSGQVLSVATIAYILQAIYVYVFSGIAKNGLEWTNGSAVHYALGLDMFATPLTPLMTSQEWLMSFLTHYTVYFEIYGCLLLFIPFMWKYFRLVGVLLFMGLHFGFFLFMTLGNFPWSAIIMWVVILPPMAADFFEKFITKKGIYSRFANYRDKIRMLLAKPSINLSLTARPYRNLGWMPSLFLLVVAVGIFCWNLSNVKKDFNCPESLKKVVRASVTWQEWNMFAPFPMKSDGWYVADAQLKSGNHFDILNDKEVVFDKPKKPSMVAATYKNERWQKYMINMWVNANKNYLRAWGGYNCDCWNKEYANTPKELESFSIYFMKEMTPPPGQPEPEAEKSILWNHWCKEEFRHRYE